jgi:hypothetical protein
MPGAWWSASNIRIPSQRVLLRMLEAKDHQQIYMQWSLGFDIRITN